MAPTSTTALADPLMLDKIDKLFACGVGELVDLPQIVVVGDQSSGKSSVLEGLIRKPLPRDSGLCTRFATQIVFRRAKVEGIQVSIIPDTDADPQHAAKVKKWGKEVKEELDSEVFVKIMEEVHIEMGLAASGGDTDGVKRPTFSNDVLRLEISGPQQEHLSVIDVPGIFKSTTDGVTTKADIALVRHMVHGYMNNPRSVILAVVPANVDVATQEILELATEADPEGDRTMGVLTKPDLVDSGGEKPTLDLLDGRTRKMKLGWHIIRNPGQREMSEAGLDRSILEKDFFRTKAPWNAIEQDKVGVNNLRIRLKEVISSLVKKEFPKVKAEIKTRLDKCQSELDRLGPERGGSAEQMAYLTEKATEFQRLVTLALKADYGADNVFSGDKALRIAPAIVARRTAFSSGMTTYGHTYNFLSAAHVPAPVQKSSSESDGDDEKRKKITMSQWKTVGNIGDVTHHDENIFTPHADGIEAWLFKIFQDHRGFELGTFNASILATAMKKQSANWQDISLIFVSDIIALVHNFIIGALETVCGDGEIRSALISTLNEDLMKRYGKAMENARFLLEVENCDNPTTMNHYFNDNLQKSRQGKIVAGMKRKAINMEGQGQVVRLADAAGHVKNMSNDEHVIHDIHDILMSYYKVSRKTFVDNVCKQSVNHYLLHGKIGPLALFSPIWVSRLSATELEEIAGEAPGTKRDRIRYSKEAESLKQAMKILARN